MNIKDFSEAQREALLDLVTLAMYADAHLAQAEDERMMRLLGKLGLPSDYERSRQYDAAVARVSRHSQSADKARAYALERAEVFSTHEQRRLVSQALDDIVTSDTHVSDKENSFISLVREALER